MKVCILTWEYPPRIVGGISRHCYSLANSLAKKGWNPTVVTLATPKRSLYVEEKGAKIVSIDPPHCSDFLTWTLLYNHMMANTAILLHQKQNFDLIHAHDWMTFVAGSIMKHALGIPMVVTFHSTERGRRGGIPSPFEKMINDIEWLGSYEASHVITVSNSLREELSSDLNVPANKISAIHNSMNLIRHVSKTINVRNNFAAPNEKIVLFVGRLVWQKGVESFIESCPFILGQHPEAKIVIVGEGIMHDDLCRRISTLGISSKVYVTGQMHDNMLNALYSCADVLVVPSLYEPFGLTALEGMASGVPVVASSVGGLNEIITHERDGILVPAGNSKEIAGAVNRILSDSNLAGELSRNGRVRARQFRSDKMVGETVKVYETVLGVSAKPSIVEIKEMINMEIKSSKSDEVKLVLDKKLVH